MGFAKVVMEWKWMILGNMNVIRMVKIVTLVNFANDGAVSVFL